MSNYYRFHDKHLFGNYKCTASNYVNSYKTSYAIAYPYPYPCFSMFSFIPKIVQLTVKAQIILCCEIGVIDTCFALLAKSASLSAMPWNVAQQFAEHIYWEVNINKIIAHITPRGICIDIYIYIYVCIYIYIYIDILHTGVPCLLTTSVIV